MRGFESHSCHELILFLPLAATGSAVSVSFLSPFLFPNSDRHYCRGAPLCYDNARVILAGRGIQVTRNEWVASRDTDVSVD